MSDTFQLNGTLSIPTGNKDKYPIIIFAHGSGQNDRNQTTPIIGGNSTCLYPHLVNDTIKNFLDLSNFLVSKGYATLRFDKRSYTYGNSIDPKTITIYDFIKDIESAIDYAKTLENIDTSCINLLGHSQGGTLIPYIARKRNDIKKLIALATPSTAIDTLISMQIRELYYKCQHDTATGNNLYHQSINIYNQIRNNTWSNNTPINGAYPIFWKSWIDVSDSILYNINQANIPIYFTFGLEDFNVPITDTSKFIHYLNNDFQLESFNNLTHFLTDSTNPIVKSDILASLLQWLGQNECATTTNIVENKNDFKFINTLEFIEIRFKNTQSRTVAIYDLLGRKIYTNQTNNRRVRIEKKEAQKLCIFEIINNEKLTKTTFKSLY